MPICEFCRDRFSNDRGLKSHRTRCRGQESILQESLAKRRQAKELLKQSNTGKRARVECSHGPEVMAVDEVPVRALHCM